jgi:CRISPR-associated endonuclease/helicase Cas3
MIDCLMPDGINGFKKRIDKEDDKSHLTECKQNADTHILEQAQRLANKPLPNA